MNSQTKNYSHSTTVERERDDMIAESKETLNRIKTLRVLGELKRDVQERMDFANPCIACDEYQYHEQSGALKAFEECISLINEKIKNLE